MAILLTLTTHHNILAISLTNHPPQYTGYLIDSNHPPQYTGYLIDSNHPPQYNGYLID